METWNKTSQSNRNRTETQNAAVKYKTDFKKRAEICFLTVNAGAFLHHGPWGLSGLMQKHSGLRHSNIIMLIPFFFKL